MRILSKIVRGSPLSAFHQGKTRASVFRPKVLVSVPGSQRALLCRAGLEGLTQVREHLCLVLEGKTGLELVGYALYPKILHLGVSSFLKHPKQQEVQWKGKIPLVNSPADLTNE